MFQNSDAYFDKEIFNEIVDFVLEKRPLTNLIENFLKLAKLKETKILINKYASKFDVEKTLE